jgi:hypothetical protein
VKILKRTNAAAHPDDAALTQRLEAIVGRGKIEKAIHEGREAVPSIRS